MYEILVGLNVIDDDVYCQYREAMAPILRQYGGSFGYDFKVSEVLQSKSDNDINRVFTIRFSDEQAQESFFSDANYQTVKSRYFELSVNSTTIIARYLTN